MPTDLHRYAVFGLGVASELPLPELTPSDDAGEAQLTIRVGPVRDPPAIRGPLSVAGDVTCLASAAARFRVCAGAEIIVDPYPGAAERDVRGYLLGPVLGIVCHQRGLLPLHASAVVAGGRGVAFAGPSGAGKSTLAAHFQARGYPVLCDDICALEAADGAPRVLPGVARLKLWPDMLRRLGHATADDGAQKGQLALARPGATTGAPLACVYLLAPPGADQRFAIEPLVGAAAAAALMANLFRAQYLAPMGLVRQAFAATTAMARRVPVFALRGSGELAEFEREADRLERHFALTPQGAPA